MRSNMSRRIVSSIGLGLGLTLCVNLQAIAANLSKCSTTQQNIDTAPGLTKLSNLVVSISNTKARKVMVSLSADICVPSVVSAYLSWSVNGAAPVNIGAINIADHQEGCESRSSFAVISLPIGLHTITPYWRLVGAAGLQGSFFTGCLVVQPLIP